MLPFVIFNLYTCFYRHFIYNIKQGMYGNISISRQIFGLDAQKTYFYSHDMQIKPGEEFHEDFRKNRKKTIDESVYSKRAQQNRNRGG